MQLERPFVLSIAGLDPSAGAGLLADIKTFEALRVYGLGVSSAITVQDEEKVYHVTWLSGEQMIQQADVLFNKYTIKVCKIGLMPDKETLTSIISYLKARNPNIKIVVDPVLRSSSGFAFYKDEDVDFWKAIAEQITLLTPNYLEMEILSGSRSVNDTALEWSLNGSILVKGGHNLTNPGMDSLFSGGEVGSLHAEVLHIHQKHGSGCVLSSAIAAYLALNFTVQDACKLAKKYTERFLNSNTTLLGFHS